MALLFAWLALRATHRKEMDFRHSCTLIFASSRSVLTLSLKPASRPSCLLLLFYHFSISLFRTWAAITQCCALEWWGSGSAGRKRMQTRSLLRCCTPRFLGLKPRCAGVETAARLGGRCLCGHLCYASVCTCESFSCIFKETFKLLEVHKAFVASLKMRR